ncbi:MAG TPA: YciI family protein [Thermopetrobacter sp.]|nr:YciI family protein [Thermopetrobacter sp.]
MSLYAIICTDRPGEGLKLRAANRPDHLKWLDELGRTVVAAGPFLDEEGNPAGSLIIIEACSLDAARAIAAGDPYARAGVFEKVEIRPWKWLINKPAGM